MHSDVDQTGKLFRYEHIVNKLKEQILAGVFPANGKLPSVRALMHQETISLATANRVFHDLERAGYVYAKARSGYFVLPHMPATSPTSSVSAPMFDLSDHHLHATLTPRSLMNQVLKGFAKNPQSNHMQRLEAPGWLDLRRAIARMMASRGVICGPDEIVILEGEGIMLELALRMANPSCGLVAIESPSPPILRDTLQRLGMTWIDIDTDPVTGIDLEALNALLASGSVTCVWLSPTLQQPLGYSLSNTCRANVARLLETYRVTLIEDDSFCDLHDGQHDLLPIRHYYRGDNMLYCSSFTKVLAPGYQVGWCLPGRFRAALLADVRQRHLPASPLQQMVLADFLKTDGYEEHTSHLARLFGRYRSKLGNLVRQHFPGGSKLSQPEGGFSYWLALPKGVDAERVQKRALAAGIVVSTLGGIKHFGSALSLSVGRHWNHDLESAVTKVGQLCYTPSG